MASASIARRVADAYAQPGSPRFVAGSMGPGTKFPTLGQITYDDLSASYEELRSGLLDGGVDLLLVETVYDLLSGKAAIAACHRAMVAAGRVVPIQVQVTIELTGRMLPGTEIGAAITALAPAGRRRRRAELRDRPGRDVRAAAPAAASPRPCRCRACPTRDCPAWSTARCTTTYARRARRAPRRVRRGIRRARRRRLLRHDPGAPRRASSNACGRWPPPGARPSSSRPSRRSTRRPPTARTVVSCWSASAPTPTGPRSSARPCSRATGTPASASAATRSKRAPTSSTSASTTPGADGVADMNELMSRLATQSSVPIMVDTTETQSRAHRRSRGSAARRSSTRSTSKRVTDRARASTASCGLAAEFGAAVVATCIDEEGQARTAEWKVRAARAITELAVTRYGLDPRGHLHRHARAAAVDGHGRVAPRRHRDHRGDPPDQGRAARRAHRSSDCPTSPSASTPPRARC